uniref:EB domain-containing protein n=1 Tax=Romanomermis culicivorax TaxID=13658 RepID=A0A915IX17_ROMCU
MCDETLINPIVITNFANAIISENSPCVATDRLLHPLHNDTSKYLACDTKSGQYKAVPCPKVANVQYLFDPLSGRCALKFSDHFINEPKVDDKCENNQDCATGMYCHRGFCACFLNYVQIRDKCIRVSRICANSYFYADTATGKPKTCQTDFQCPAKFSCINHDQTNDHLDINFCCYQPYVPSKPARDSSDLCGNGSSIRLEYGRELSCWPHSRPCPDDYECRYNRKLKRHYCCTPVHHSTPSIDGVAAEISSPIVEIDSYKKLRETQTMPPFLATKTVKIELTPSGITVEPFSKAVSMAEIVCGPQMTPWTIEDFPIPCNPLPPGNCPLDYTCRAFNKTKLHFCCTNRKNRDKASPSTSSAATSTTIPPSSTTTLTSTTPETTTTVGATTEASKKTLMGFWTKSASSFKICPKSTPYLAQGQPLLCDPDHDTCPTNYECRLHERINIIHQKRSICGHAEPLIWRNSAVKCDRDDSDSCPSKFSCSYDHYTDESYCCSSSKSPPEKHFTDDDGCPNFSTSAKDPFDRSILCEPYGSSSAAATVKCPTGFKCVYSAKNKRHQCCDFHDSLGTTPSRGGKGTTVPPRAPVASRFFESKTTQSMASVEYKNKNEQEEQEQEKSRFCPSGGEHLVVENLSRPLTCDKLRPCPTDYFCTPSAIELVDKSRNKSKQDVDK